MPTTVLVTGATGTVGSLVTRELSARGVFVRAFVRDRAKAARTLGDVELASGDFADATTVRRALSGVDAVFLASPNHPRQLEYETGVIYAAAAAGVRRVVKLSTIGAQIGSPLAFWDCHGRIEEALHQSMVPAVVLRSNFYMSNLLAAAEQVRSEGRLFAPAAGARIAMIDPGDVAAVAAVALTVGGHQEQTLVLTGPEALTYQDVAVALTTATGRPVEFVDVPDEGARQGFLAAGLPEWVAENLIVLFSLLRKGAAERTTDTVRGITGRVPRSFAQFARDHAQLFRPAPLPV